MENNPTQLNSRDTRAKEPSRPVLGLVVNRARGTAVFVRQALLDLVAVEADFVQQRRAGAVQVVDGVCAMETERVTRYLGDSACTAAN